METKKFKIIDLYNGEIQIKFIEDSHQYWLMKSDNSPKMKRLSGVTSYTGLIDKSRPLLIWSENLSREALKQNIGKVLSESIIEEAVTQYKQKKEEACTTGHLVHSWIETYIKNKLEGSELPVYPQDEQAMNGILAFLDWENKNNVQWIASERIVYSKKYQYVGTADAIAVINGVKYLVDFKTGKSIYPEAHLQVSGYILAYEEEFNEKLEGLILHFDKETGEFGETKAKVDTKMFISLVNLKNYLSNF